MNWHQFRARVRALWGVSGGRGNEGIGTVTFCREAPDGLSLAQFHPSPCRARTGRKNSGRSAKRLACRARVLLAKVPIALKRAVGLSGPSSSRQSAPILQQWSEQVCRSFEAGQAMSHSDANCAKPRTGFRSRPADPWKLGARSLPEQQPPPARAPGGPFLIESAILSFPLHPLRPHNARTRVGAWQRAEQFCFFTHPIRDVAGSTLGIVGFGALGKAVARRAEGLGMRVLATDFVLAPGLVDLPTVLRSSDAVTLHAPLTDDTRNLIGAEQLAMMRRNAILINTARGGLVDEGALAQALQDGIIGGARFDVLTNEPFCRPAPKAFCLSRSIHGNSPIRRRRLPPAGYCASTNFGLGT